VYVHAGEQTFEHPNRCIVKARNLISTRDYLMLVVLSISFLFYSFFVVLLFVVTIHKLNTHTHTSLRATRHIYLKTRTACVTENKINFY
jgi:hypothetical protein